jgi:hypothetical protein
VRHCLPLAVAGLILAAAGHQRSLDRSADVFEATFQSWTPPCCISGGAVSAAWAGLVGRWEGESLPGQPGSRLLVILKDVKTDNGILSWQMCLHSSLEVLHCNSQPAVSAGWAAIGTASAAQHSAIRCCDSVICYTGLRVPLASHVISDKLWWVRLRRRGVEDSHNRLRIVHALV